MNFEMTDDEAREILAALGDTLRFEIFRRLLSTPKQTATQLADKAPATVSHHLSIMERAGLLTVEKSGRQKLYTLHHETLFQLATWSNGAAQLAVLARLGDYSANSYPD